MIHAKYNKHWWNKIFYIDMGTYQTECFYWDTLVIWLFKCVVFEKTLEFGTLLEGERVIKRRSKLKKFLWKEAD